MRDSMAIGDQIFIPDINPTGYLQDGSINATILLAMISQPSFRSFLKSLEMTDMMGLFERSLTCTVRSEYVIQLR